VSFVAKESLIPPPSTLNPIPLPSRYAKIPEAQQVYEALCYALSKRREQVDWESFTPRHWKLLERMAQNEGVAPLLYWNLKDSDLPVPEETFQYLQGEYYKTYARNTLLYQELGRVLAALEQAGIPVIVLKGAALAVTVYEDIGIRPMADLDLLVPEERLQRAVQVARQALGYQSDVPEAAHGLNQLVGHHVRLRNGDVVLELHWSLATSRVDHFPISVEWFWTQGESLPLSGGGEDLWHGDGRKLQASVAPPGVTLNPVAQLVYLAIHAMQQHGGGRILLVWLCDIHALLRAYTGELAWENFPLQDGEFQWAGATYAALLVTQTCFDSTLPEGLLEKLEEESRSEKTSLIWMKQYEPPTRMISQLQKLKGLRWQGRIRLTLAMLFPSYAYLRWRYGITRPWQVLIYYPYRWVDVIMDGLKSMKYSRR
jgi:hypothetical protein